MLGIVAVSGKELLDDEDVVGPMRKRYERNSHDHHDRDHHHHHHGGSDDGGGGNRGGDLLEFFRQVGVRLTDGKDREGADDLGNGKVAITKHMANH